MSPVEFEDEDWTFPGGKPIRHSQTSNRPFYLTSEQFSLLLGIDLSIIRQLYLVVNHVIVGDQELLDLARKFIESGLSNTEVITDIQDYPENVGLRRIDDKQKHTYTVVFERTVS